MALLDANTYCTENDMADVLSQSGINLRVDDIPPSDLANALAKAGSEIDKFLYRTYKTEDLATSPLVRDWAAVLACWFLCLRRGNPPPPGIATLYEGVIADLTEIKLGQNDVPRIPRRKAYAPGLSVMLATQRPFPRAVVEKSRGTTLGGVPANYHQHNSVYDSFGWNATNFLDWSG